MLEPLKVHGEIEALAFGLLKDGPQRRRRSVAPPARSLTQPNARAHLPP